MPEFWKDPIFPVRYLVTIDGPKGCGELKRQTAKRSAASVPALRVTCWACGKKIQPDKAPRALCVDCAYGGYFGGS